MNISVYHFLMMGHEVTEIRIHAVTHHLTTGEETIINKSYTGIGDRDIYSYRHYDVKQFKIIKKGCIDIIAYREVETF